MTILNVLSLFIIGTIPIFFAAVQPWVWSIYCLLLIAVFILYLWATLDQPVLPRVRFLNKSVTIFFIWTLFLCIPFPNPALSFLSPKRAEILYQCGSAYRQQTCMGIAQLSAENRCCLVGLSTQSRTFLSRSTKSMH
jgi:hypothetical protein